VDKITATALIKGTFENGFDKGRFEKFINQLLNRYVSKPFSQNGPYIKDQFKGHISAYDRLGQYTDPDGILIDILVVRTHKESSLARARTLQRNFIAWYLNGGRGGVIRDAALVAVVSPNEETWRFSFVRMDYKLTTSVSGNIHGDKDFSPARRYSFLVGKNENTHTAQERLLQFLQNDDSHPTLDALQQAFSVEKVTSDFYAEYDKVFKTVEGKIEGLESDKRLFTQRLFNRLLFIRFLEKKKWLRYGGDYNYLEALFDAAKQSGQNFYRDRLRVLFFEGLGRVSDCPPDMDESNRLKAVRGEVPFLNGGLFEKESGDDSLTVKIPNEAFDLIFERLLRIYNFTVEEGTPVDVDVAVDPEMLGRIFEELVTGRHDTGSYYTPKPIVSFMSREALKGYLSDALSGESTEAIAKFVDQHDPSGVRNGEWVLDALRKVRVCDPACGSGAYLLGMLHELVDLRSSLLLGRKGDDEALYAKKLQIINQNLYGVDLYPFAVNIARLRLWLSLVVDDNRSPLDDPSVDVSLPNLDFKVEVGDSVRTPQPAVWQTHDLFRTAAVRRFAEIKSRYMRSHGEQKTQLREELRTARAEIAAVVGRECSNDFDWQVEFAEVFLPEESKVTIGGALNLGQQLAAQPEPGGFDIVMANPPYVRSRLIRDIKPDLKRTYGGLFCGTADLYVYFYIRAIQLLKPGGMMAFISSNKWFRANYGAKLREFIARDASVLSITDFGDLPVFEGATAYPMIFIARKGKARKDNAVYTQVKSLDEPYPDVSALNARYGQILPSSAFASTNWALADSSTAAFLTKMGLVGIPLSKYVKNQIHYGIKTGFNTAFVIDGAKRAELIASDSRSAEIIKPLAVGRDIKKWGVDIRDRWLIVAKNGVDMECYPAIFAYLKQWQPELEKRWDKGQHWWELRSCDYYDAFAKPKILYPIIGRSPCFAFDNTGCFTNDKTFIIPVYDLYLLGVLNSSSVWSAITTRCSTLQGGFWELRAAHLSSIRIPEALEEDRTAIAILVKQCLDAKGVGCEEWEKEIDERVAALYGL